MKRLFFALWPDESTRQKCAKISNKIVPEKGRAVLAANIHVTLLFLGNTDSGKEDAIKKALATITIPEITLRFDNLSFWRKLGILSLTTTAPNLEIGVFVETLSKLARSLEIPIDERPFKAHVTLVKKATNLTQLEFEPIVWFSRSFCLVESRRDSNGIGYRIVENWGEN